MSLSTDGWDYGYHINLKKVNEDILLNSKKNISDVTVFINSSNINISLGPSTFNSLNNAILLELRKDANSKLIKDITLYKDLNDNFLSTFILPRTATARILSCGSVNQKIKRH